MESPVPLSVVTAMLIALYMVLSACAADPSPTAASHAPLTDVYHSPRSLAFDARAQRVLQDPGATRAQPWYLDRNDAEASIAIGVQTSRLVQTYTWRADRQHQIGDRVFDNFSETTYTRTIREAAW